MKPPHAPQANNPISFILFSFSKRKEEKEMEFAALPFQRQRCVAPAIHSFINQNQKHLILIFMNFEWRVQPYCYNIFSLSLRESKKKSKVLEWNEKKFGCLWLARLGAGTAAPLHSSKTLHFWFIPLSPILVLFLWGNIGWFWINGFPAEWRRTWELLMICEIKW